MTGLVCDDFDTYGDDISLLLNGLYADVTPSLTVTTLEIPSFETEGRYYLRIDDFIDSGVRRVFGARTTLGFFVRPYFPNLPAANNRVYIFEGRDIANGLLMTVRLTTDGNLQVANSAGTIVATTSAPCITAGTLHKIQFQVTMGSPTGAIEIRVDGNTVLDATGLVMAGTMTQFFMGAFGGFAGGPVWYIKDYAAYSLAGTYNSDWPLITGVTHVYPDEDTTPQGMTPRPRQIIEAGDLLVQGTGSVLDCGSNTDYDLGNGDYTLETFVRFSTLPTGSTFATLLGKWSTSTSQQSYRLVKYGPSANAGALRFEITTDGTLGTLTPIFSAAWDPQIGHIYNVAVSRTSGVTRVFIDGVQIGNPISDGNTYFAATAKFTEGGEMSGVGTAVLANSSINGIFDETRITVGVGRYTTNYTPTAVPYPRSSPADPNFADVVLLMGFDDAIVDESSQSQTLVARGSTSRIVPDDGSFAYQTINPTEPLDDRFLEASFGSAVGVLTLTGNVSATNTVVLGAKTYTFVAVLIAANNVLVGATALDSLTNLKNAINQGPGEGTTYGTGTTANVTAFAALGPTADQLTAQAIAPGAAGNSIVTTDTISAGGWAAATLVGGSDIPGPANFGLSSLDPRVTGVRWLEARKRAWVSAGTGKLQLSFVVDGSDDAGAEQSLTTTPTYYFDVFEEDPDTGTGLTPQSVSNGEIKLERTE